MGKTKPFSIRFNDDKLTFLMKELGIESAQKGVDYLIEKFYWERTIGGNPILERRAPTHEPSTFPPKEPLVLKKNFGFYLKQIKYLEEDADCLGFVADVESNTDLTAIQKNTLLNTLKSKW